jgi:UDP-glucuronate 4-epimerase
LPSIENPALYIETNIKGTFNIFEVAKTFGIKHCVIASSSSVYGETKFVPFTETDPADRPYSPYAATKRATELFAYNYYHLYDISCSCLRFFTVYGPRGRMDMAPFKFLNSIYNDKTITMYSDGSSMRDYTYIDDIVDGVIRAIDIPCGFEIFNLGRGEPILLKDFIATIEQVVGKKAKIVQKEAFAGDVPLTYTDISHAKEKLGYQSKTSLFEGISRTYAWYKKEYLSGLS